MKFVVELDGRITVSDGDGNVVVDANKIIEEHLDQVMEELIHLGAMDPSIDVDLTVDEAGGAVAFSVMVEAGNPIGAASQASGLLRTAIHAAGGATPDWPGPHEEVWACRLIGMRSELVDA